MDSEISGNRRFNLDGPPPSPSARPAPATPEALYTSSSGAVTPGMEGDDAGIDSSVQGVASALAAMAQVESLLEEISLRFQQLTPICSDFITVMRQLLPQQIAAMQSNQPMARTGANATVSQLGSLFGGGAATPQPIAGPAPIAPPPGLAGGAMG